MIGSIRSGGVMFCTILLFGFLGTPTTRAAETIPCGDIIAPGYFFDPAFGGEAIERRDVIDCDDPFQVDTVPPSPYTLVVDGSEVVSGGTVTVAPLGTRDVTVVGTPTGLGPSRSFLLRHDGDDYVYFDLEPPSLLETDYLGYINIFFAVEEDRVLYRDIVAAQFRAEDLTVFFENEDGEPHVDSRGADVRSEYYAFLDAVDQALLPEPTMVREGTYTMVVKEYELTISKQWWHGVKSFFVPTAFADTVPLTLTYAITFTVREAEEAIGAPSLLFLPGIMGSRLYEDSAACSMFGTVSRRERWVSSDDCDINRLHLDIYGSSINDIYTTTSGVIDDVAAIINLYESLREDLEDWNETGTIAAYEMVSYDWRLSLYDVLKTRVVDDRIVYDETLEYTDGYVYQRLADLVAASPNGKVVLVGHSNGGLVAKTLLAAMKAANDPLLEAIEHVILVAVPQAGTPEAILGLLHGVAMGPWGSYISHVESRQLMNTAPFGYHLLPQATYFDLVDTPVVTFEEGTSTRPWIERFGEALITSEALTAFLQKESGRETPSWEDVATPATVYSHLLGYASLVHEAMTDWQPTGATVYEVAGVGIPTPAGLTYFTDHECTRREPFPGGAMICVEFGPKLGYRVIEVVDGDGTVLAPSALALPAGSEREKWWLDLVRYDSVIRNRVVHRDIFEVAELRDFIKDTTQNVALEDYRYLSTSSPNISSAGTRLVYQLHSPLDLSVVLSDGEVVGSSTSVVRGVEYRRYGEVQTLSIPSEERDYSVRLEGVATGSFTFDIDAYTGNSLSSRVTYSAIPSSTSTKIRVNDDDSGDVVLEIDYDGDGVFESRVNPGLADVRPVVTEATETTGSHTTGTRVKKLVPALRGELAEFVVVEDVSVHKQLIRVLTLYRDLLMFVLKDRVKLNV